MADLKPSLSEHVVAYEPGEPVQAAAFLGNVPALARDDGHVTLGLPGEARSVAVHREATILCSALVGTRLLTGGDDGRIVTLTGDGRLETLHDAKGKWIDALATRADGAIAWAIGKSVTARDPKVARSRPRSPPRRAASPSLLRATASRSRITTAPACGFPIPRRRPIPTSGRARISR